MKKIILAIIFLLSFSANISAQYNFVPNPSFEEYDSIPLYLFDSTLYTYLYLPKYWFVPVSCDFHVYYNAKLDHVDTAGGTGISPYGVPQNPWSYTFPYDGLAQTSVVLLVINPIEGQRNYLEVKLKDSLMQGHKYCVRFFVTLADSAYISIDQIGACFTSDSLIHYDPWGDPPCYLAQIPQVVSPPGHFFNIRNQWQCVSGTFIAQGGEQFLSIGNFNIDANTNYIFVPDSSIYQGSFYHIDMVSVIECDTNIVSAYAGKRSQICLGDSVMLGTTDSLPGYEFVWSPGAGLSDSCIQNPMASPLHTTIYTLSQSYYNSNQTTDTVSVIVKVCNPYVEESLNERSLHLRVYPNPAKDLLTIECANSEDNNVTALFEVFDLFGKKLFEKIVQPNQKTTVSTDLLAQGVYFYKFLYKTKIVKKDKLIIIK